MIPLNPNAKGSVEDFLAGAPEEAGITEPTKTSDTTKESSKKSMIEAFREDFPSAPPAEVVESWKEAFGSVSVFVANESYYIFRPLRRVEYSRIAQQVNQLRQTGSAQQDPSIVERQLQEKVVGACILAPSDLVSNPTKLNMLPAGLLPTLFELIMSLSMFFSPEAALSNTYKL